MTAQSRNGAPVVAVVKAADGTRHFPGDGWDDAAQTRLEDRLMAIAVAHQQQRIGLAGGVRAALRRAWRSR